MLSSAECAQCSNRLHERDNADEHMFIAVPGQYGIFVFPAEVHGHEPGHLDHGKINPGPSNTLGGHPLAIPKHQRGVRLPLTKTDRIFGAPLGRSQATYRFMTEFVQQLFLHCRQDAVRPHPLATSRLSPHGISRLSVPHFHRFRTPMISQVLKRRSSAPIDGLVYVCFVNHLLQ